MDQPLFIFFGAVILIFSAVVHEVFHGLAANALGDDTALMEGRLTFNPLKHLDLWGSLIIPVSVYILSAGNFIFGWAKPVPFNPYKLRYPKWGPGIVAAAGPLVNILMAVVFGLGLRFLNLDIPMIASLIKLFSFIVLINIGLAVFNLMPIPPLDGSKVLFSFFPPKFKSIEIWLETYGFFLLLLFIFFGINLLFPVIRFIFSTITGQGNIF